MAGTLTGKAAVVTGSGQSIGRAIALLLAAEGAAVVTNSRSPASADATPTAEDTAAEIHAAGGTATVVFADVGTMEGARAVVDGCVSAFGGIDILVNNAGFGATVLVQDMDERVWNRVLAVNLKSCYAAAHFAVPHMMSRGGGRILNVTSRVGLAGAASMSAYAAAKAGAVGLTLALAKELAPHRITVNCLAPTANTVRARRSAAERYAMTGRVIPGSPARTPERVAPLAAYLVGDRAASVTGQIFYAAGGEITLYDAATPRRSIHTFGTWTVEELATLVPAVFGERLDPPVSPLPPMH